MGKAFFLKYLQKTGFIINLCNLISDFGKIADFFIQEQQWR